jgi:hypothetical protein
MSTLMTKHNLLLVLSRLTSNHHVSLLRRGCGSSCNLVLICTVLGGYCHVGRHHQVLVVALTTVILILQVISFIGSCGRICKLALWLVLERTPELVDDMVVALSTWVLVLRFFASLRTLLLVDQTRVLFD